MTSYDERKKTLEALEKNRGSVIVTYVTLTDRANAPNLTVADDAMRPLYDLLERIGPQQKIDLFLYTRGGAMMSAYTIVKMFREYAEIFNVIIPFRAHSAGTQIALGADEIVMTKIGQLSPVDPSTINLFNPLLVQQGDPRDPRNRKPISVEDVQSYLNLAKEKVGLVSESDSLEVFRELTKYYEPLALGNVNRVYSETRVIAREMLSLHMDVAEDEEKIDRIIKALTEQYTHDFLITRDAAEKIGLKVSKPSMDDEKLIMELYESYERELKANLPFDPDVILARANQAPVTPSPQSVAGPTPPQPTLPPARPVDFKMRLGAIESKDYSYTWVSEGTVYPCLSQIVQQVIAQPGMYPPSPMVKVKSGAWHKTDTLGGTFD